MFHRLASTWLPRLFGVGEDAIPADADVELVWTNAPRSWGVFLLLAISAGLIWLVWRFYRTEKGSCPMWMRRLLAGLRVLVVDDQSPVLMRGEDHDGEAHKEHAENEDQHDKEFTNQIHRTRSLSLVSTNGPWPSNK